MRRNDEVALLRDRTRLLQDSLVQGERALNARRDDIRLLTIEVLELLEWAGGLCVCVL